MSLANSVPKINPGRQSTSINGLKVSVDTVHQLLFKRPRRQTELRISLVINYGKVVIHTNEPIFLRVNSP